MAASAGSENRNEHQSIGRTDVGHPQDPEFFSRVLSYLPTPLVVLNSEGCIDYFNHALAKLGGWDLVPGAGHDFVSYVHPDDRDMVAAAFASIVECPTARIFGGQHWAEISFRLVGADGSTIPVECVGSGGLLDSAVGGIIYEVRPAQRSELTRRILDGLSNGASMLQLLSLVAEMIASRPLELDAVILQSTPAGGFALAASTSTELDAVIRAGNANMPWHQLAKTPMRVDPADLPPEVRQRFVQSRYEELWYVSIESPLTASTLRIISASPYSAGTFRPNDRLLQAREIAAAVLLRTQADVMLAHAAEHDMLTDLPNRAAFYQLAESLDPALERAALHLDIDGMKPVNDSHGAHCGDAILQVLADRIRVICSPCDAIGRIGDDEFAVLITQGSTSDGSAPMDRAVELAGQVLNAVNEPIIVAGRCLQVSASIGVAAIPPNMSTDHLLTWADAAMHDAKAAGGGRISRFGVAFG